MPSPPHDLTYTSLYSFFQVKQGFRCSSLAWNYLQVSDKFAFAVSRRGDFHVTEHQSSRLSDSRSGYWICCVNCSAMVFRVRRKVKGVLHLPGFIRLAIKAVPIFIKYRFGWQSIFYLMAYKILCYTLNYRCGLCSICIQLIGIALIKKGERQQAPCSLSYTMGINVETKGSLGGSLCELIPVRLLREVKVEPSPGLFKHLRSQGDALAPVEASELLRGTQAYLPHVSCWVKENYTIFKDVLLTFAAEERTSSARLDRAIRVMETSLLMA